MEEKINVGENTGERDKCQKTGESPWIGLLTVFFGLFEVFGFVIGVCFGITGLIVIFVGIGVPFGIVGIVTFYKAFASLRKPRDRKNWQEIGNKIIDVTTFTLLGILYSSMSAFFLWGLYYVLSESRYF
jgi:hypothetical protein